jgi:hypothetical protein
MKCRWKNMNNKSQGLVVLIAALALGVIVLIAATWIFNIAVSGKKGCNWAQDFGTEIGMKYPDCGRSTVAQIKDTVDDVGDILEDPPFLGDESETTSGENTKPISGPVLRSESTPPPPPVLFNCEQYVTGSPSAGWFTAVGCGQGTSCTRGISWIKGAQDEFVWDRRDVSERYVWSEDVDICCIPHYQESSEEPYVRPECSDGKKGMRSDPGSPFPPTNPYNGNIKMPFYSIPPTGTCGTECTSGQACLYENGAPCNCNCGDKGVGQTNAGYICECT